MHCRNRSFLTAPTLNVRVAATIKENRHFLLRYNDPIRHSGLSVRRQNFTYSATKIKYVSSPQNNLNIKRMMIITHTRPFECNSPFSSRKLCRTIFSDTEIKIHTYERNADSIYTEHPRAVLLHTRTAFDSGENKMI